MHKQQRLAPELKALMALSTEGHTGWIAKLEKAGSLHKTSAHPSVALRSSRTRRRALSKGSEKV